MVEGGIDLKDVNVGNMHFSEGKKQISSKVYVDDQDLADLRFIKQRGVNVFIQDVPGDQKEQILTKSKIALILVWGNKNAWNNPTSGIIPGGV